jgi:hypothetical protein
MKSMQTRLDAKLYRLVHEMVYGPEADVGRDRRQHARKAYRAIQRMAPWSGDVFPDEDDFFDVACRDLTQAGFSFLLPTEPDFTLLVAEFGKGADAICVAAEVLRAAGVLLYPGGNVEPRRNASARAKSKGRRKGGIPMFLIGCRFVRRIRKPRLPL